MRLRLVIQRNELQPANLCWFIPGDFTVAQLLHNVNDFIPLRSADWALNQYVVEVPGHYGLNYEIMHFEQLRYYINDDSDLL